MKTTNDKPQLNVGPGGVGWGAARENWIRLHKLGLTADLLPVVSNLHSRIAPRSTLKGTGKTPSLYNQNGMVVGFKEWTQHQSTLEEVKHWAEEPDYGICIQTRLVRALDVDVTDPELAKRIHAFISARVGFLPMRYRENSSKFLLAFKMEGEFGKRRMKVGEKQYIEFLANGQQFVAFGTHPSGSRYEWRWGGLDDLPVVDVGNIFGGL